MERLRTPSQAGALALGAAALGALAAPAADAQVTFVERTGPANPFDAILFPFVTPDFGDIDGDGDLDLVFSEKFGGVLAYENVGTPSAPSFALAADTTFLGGGSDIGESSSPPALADLDGDGDLDGVLSNQEGPTSATGELRYFENVGTPQRPRLVERTGADNPLGDITASISQAAFADLDADGDLDLVGAAETLRYYENTGTATAPAFAERTGAANPLDGIEALGVTLGDGEGDGDLDLVLSDKVGDLFTYENIGTPSAPSFRAVPAARDPFADLDDPYARPRLVDLDADGDLDLALGTQTSGIRYFENVTPRSARSTVLAAAGVAAPAAVRDGDGALLAWTHEGAPATYEVQRLLGHAGAFELIGTVRAENGRTLRFHTGPLAAGPTRLRLRRVEADGRSAYSPTAEVRTGLAGTHALSAPYPNPSAGSVQLVLTVAETQPVTVRLYDAAGRHVADAFAGALEAGVSERLAVGAGLSAGVYFVRVEGEHFQDVRRFTVLP